MDHAKKHDQPIQHDGSGAPILVSVNKHISQLERMRDFRATALAQQRETPGVLQYYAQEKTALNAAISALVYHRAHVQRLPEPVGMLRDLVAAFEHGTDGRIREVVKRAQVLLEEYPANEAEG